MDTIAALATAHGKSALAVIRLSGPAAHEFFRKCTSASERFLASAPRTIASYMFVHPLNREEIDHLTAIRYCSPQSYTGEDMVEMICHGGAFVTERVLSALVVCGARIARPGEFTRRAFTNRKMDLSRAEAVAAIAESSSDAGLASALLQYRGNSREEINNLRESLKEALVSLEAHLEFPEEEDTQKDTERDMWNILNKTAEYIKLQLVKKERVKHNEHGITVAIAGMANAGKSTAFNKILEKDRAIVHHTEGTTRDSISEDIYLNDMHLTLFDSAGIGATDNEVEKLGIKRAWQLIESCDIALWITSAENAQIAEEEKRLLNVRSGKPVLAVINKTDLAECREKRTFCSEKGIQWCAVSMAQANGGEQVRSLLSDAVRSVYGNFKETTIIISVRQECLLREILRILEGALALKGQEGDEILADRMKKILEKMEEFSGVVSSEQILDDIFSRFCIGK